MHCLAICCNYKSKPQTQYFLFLKAVFQVNQVKRYPLAIVTWTRQRGAFSDLDYLRFPLYLQLSISEARG